MDDPHFLNESVKREHPFNLKGRGGYAILGNKFLLANLMEKKNLSLTWAEKKYSESILCLKKIVFVEEKNVDSEKKNHSHPPPLR